MDRTLRVLLIEDSEPDAALILLHLSRGGFVPTFARVSTAPQLAAELEDRSWDVVICDYALPGFSAHEALRIVRQHALDIPFIIVSGAIGEETAVRLMKAGVQDYILKGKLARLLPAIEREMQEARERHARRRAERIFQAILQSSPDPSVIVRTDTLEIIEASRSLRQIARIGDVRGKKLFETISFSQPERIAQLLGKYGGSAWGIIFYDEEEARVANARVQTIEHEGESFAYIVLEDVTEQHHLKAAFDAAPHAVLIINAQSRLLYANRVAESLFDPLYVGMDITPVLTIPGLEPEWWSRATTRYDEHRLTLRDDPYAASIVAFRFAGESTTSTILTVRSLAAEEELLELANHDALTGLHNLRYLNQRLAEQLGRASGTHGVLAIIDLDHLKPINDELGHPAGDAALMRFANVIRAAVDPETVVARIGGDEFAILFPRQSLAAAEREMARVFAKLDETTFVFDGKTIPFSASGGLTRIVPGDTYDTVKARADAALYRAKRAGRGRYMSERLEIRRSDGGAASGTTEERPPQSRPA